jgi:hypothetical protein
LALVILWRCHSTATAMKTFSSAKRRESRNVVVDTKLVVSQVILSLINEKILRTSCIAKISFSFNVLLFLLFFKFKFELLLLLLLFKLLLVKHGHGDIFIVECGTIIVDGGRQIVNINIERIDTASRATGASAASRVQRGAIE